MAARLALGAIVGTLALSSVASAQSRCQISSVRFDSVASGILTAMTTIQATDTDQVRARLDSVRVILPDAFAYTRESIGRGSLGTTAKRDQSWKVMRDAMPGRDGIFQRVLNRLFQSSVQSAIDSAGVRQALDSEEAMMCLARDVRLFEGTEKLRRFERKFGPGSVKLNALEVLLNYGTLFLPWPRLFGVNDDYSPRPWELVSAYRTTYATIEKATGSDKKFTPQAVSVAEFGLRHYNFGSDWGAEGGTWLTRALKPGSFSLGIVIASEANGALRYPWRGDQRIGPYVAWGGLKVGYLTGKDRRVIASREVLVIPYVF